jgi:hypothetical protein
LDDGAELFLRLAGGLLANLRQRAGPEAFCDPPTQEDLLGRGDVEQVLRVGVAGEELGADDALAINAGDRVAPSAPEADDLDVGPHLAEHLFELGVHPAVFKRWSTPFPGEHIL